jgi:tetratricopeptide (TPR) repeat protein
MSATARILAGAIALAAVTGFTCPAPAQPSQAWKWCNGSEADGVSLDLQISGCTTVIQSGKESKTSLAQAFYNRGISYKDKGQYDLAIQDYDQAIRLDPSKGGSAVIGGGFNNRGIAYRYKGQYDRAIQDYDQAIKLNPDYTFAFNNRGIAYDDKKEYDRAIQNYDQAIRLEQIGRAHV